jgi:hypothetical protein
MIKSMIQRTAEETIKNLAKTFKAVTVTSPRQSGKTTLARPLFNDYTYVSLEDLDNRQFAYRAFAPTLSRSSRSLVPRYNNSVIAMSIAKTKGSNVYHCAAKWLNVTQCGYSTYAKAILAINNTIPIRTTKVGLGLSNIAIIPLG